jgi:hypothetical protein
VGWLYMGKGKEMSMISTADTYLDKSDALANSMATISDTTKLEELGTERIRHAIKAAGIYHREGNHRGETMAYMIAISAYLLLMSRKISTTGKRSYSSMIIEYCNKAAISLRESGSLLLAVKGLARVNEYLKLAYIMSNEKIERDKIENEIAHYTASLISNLCLLNKMEQENIKMAEQSAKLYSFASNTDDETAQRDFLKAANILYGCSAQNLQIAGNYRLLDDVAKFVKGYKFDQEVTVKELPNTAESGTAKNEILDTQDVIGNKKSIEHADLCPACKTRRQPEDLFCTNCGFDLRKIVKTCPQCSNELQSDDIFCPNCGRRTTDA